MSTHWKPGEYERHAKKIKNAVESLRKDEGQLQREHLKRPSTASPSNKRKPVKAGKADA